LPISYSEGNNRAKRFSAFQVCGLINVNGVQADLRYHEYPSMFNQARRPMGGSHFCTNNFVPFCYFNIIMS